MARSVGAVIIGQRRLWEYRTAVWRRQHNSASPFKRLIGTLGALAVLAGPALGQDDGPQMVVEQLNDTLLEVMQEADQLGYQDRYDMLEPVLEQAFNFPFMTRVAVGREWSDLSEAQRERLVDLFAQMSIANFAARFDGYDGEHFELVGQEPGPREAVMVRSRIVRPDDEPVGLDYLLQQFEQEWQIIDVFLDSKFSELARQRSEFSGVLRSEGYEGLIASLEQKIETLAEESG